MSFEAPRDRETVELTTVSWFALDRLAEYPVLRVRYAETVRVLEDPVAVDSAADADGDGLFEALTVSAWDGRTDLVGREVWDENRNRIGVVAAWDDATDTVTLESGPEEDPTGTLVTVQARGVFGAPLHRVAKGGREWENWLMSVGLEARQFMQTMLDTMFFSALQHGFAEAGVSKTDVEIQALVESLAEKGVTMDGIIEQVLAQLELDRRAGNAPYVRTLGDAPEA